MERKRWDDEDPVNEELQMRDIKPMQRSYTHGPGTRFDDSRRRDYNREKSPPHHQSHNGREDRRPPRAHQNSRSRYNNDRDHHKFRNPYETPVCDIEPAEEEGRSRYFRKYEDENRSEGIQLRSVYDEERRHDVESQ